MPLPKNVESYLSRCGLPYRLVPHPRTVSLEQAAEVSHITSRQMVRVVLLRDAGGVLMTVLPSSHILDFSRLCEVSERELDPLYGDDHAEIFRDCEPGSHPPLPGLYGLTALVDPSVDVPGDVYFEAGTHDVLVAMSSGDFQTLMGGVERAQFAHPVDALGHLADTAADPAPGIIDAASRYTPIHIKGGVEAVRDLPPLPDTARKVMEWRNDPKADVDRELIEIVERDPSLAAQVIRWARSPFYGYSGRVDSVKDAIVRVLGFDLVMNLVLGLTVGQAIRIPVDGPLGLHAFWRHSVYCAALVDRLARHAPDELRPKQGLAYLGGLLHNFGFLLLGHLFPAQFFLLNRFVMVNAHLPVRLVEHYVVGAEHPHIGGWLMRSWRMPPEVITAVRWHHAEDYSLPHAEYANLVLIANRLLARRHIGDEGRTELPTGVMYSLGISEEQALADLTHVMGEAEQLDGLTQVLTA